ncbi:hypothetical protein ACS0TY_006473 [Phlomoides rotata]
MGALKKLLTNAGAAEQVKLFGSSFHYVAGGENAVEEGIVVGGWSRYCPLNAGVNGSVFSEKVLSSENPKYGYNALLVLLDNMKI